MRPLARRRRRTSRPERVRIRPRKPWVFARLRFFGCQVRFMVKEVGPSGAGAGALRRATASIERHQGGGPLQTAPRGRGFFARFAGCRPRGTRGAVIVGRLAGDREKGDHRGTWAAVREELERSLPAATFDLWIEPLRATGSQDETLYLTGPPAFAPGLSVATCRRSRRRFGAKGAGSSEFRSSSRLRLRSLVRVRRASPSRSRSIPPTTSNAL